MPNRNALKFAGLLLLIPAVLAGLVPLVAEYTAWLNGVPAFDLDIGSVNLMHLVHSTTGETGATVSNWVWISAAAGEALLIGIAIWNPVRQDNSKIKVTD